MTPLLAALLLAANAAASPPATAPATAEPEREKLLYAEGRMLVLVAPRFPETAAAKGETGKVEVSGTIRTDGRLENVRVEATPPNPAFEIAVIDVLPLWRMQPRIATPGCEAADTEGHVTLWFEMDGGRPKVSYGTRPPAIVRVPDLRNDRKPVKFVPPLYPQKLALEPNAPRAILQVAYVAVADDGSVTGVTVAPMLYYREFEPLLAAAVRQWKYAPQPGPWCAEVRFQMTLD
jgi:TonB family protein